MHQFLPGAIMDFISFREEIQVHRAAVPSPQHQGCPARQIESRRKSLSADPCQQCAHAWGNSFPVWGF